MAGVSKNHRTREHRETAQRWSGEVVWLPFRLMKRATSVNTIGRKMLLAQKLLGM
jgi:hypothetical protein